MQKWFGKDSNSNSGYSIAVNKVGHKLSLLLNALKNKTIPIECECECEEGVDGYVRQVVLAWHLSGNIHLCPDAFKSLDKLSNVLIHEMTHKYSVTKDHGYFQSSGKEGSPDMYIKADGTITKLPSFELFYNADTYSNMIMEEFYK